MAALVSFPFGLSLPVCHPTPTFTARLRRRRNLLRAIFSGTYFRLQPPSRHVSFVSQLFSFLLFPFVIYFFSYIRQRTDGIARELNTGAKRKNSQGWGWGASVARFARLPAPTLARFELRSLPLSHA